MGGACGMAVAASATSSMAAVRSSDRIARPEAPEHDEVTPPPPLRRTAMIARCAATTALPPPAAESS